jgi:hypothetical protein
MTGALAPPRAAELRAFAPLGAPPEILASEAALSRPSALSAALSQMLADPLWHRGLHPKQSAAVPDPLIRRVEYCTPRDPSPSIRRPRSRSSSIAGQCSRSNSRSTVAPSEADVLENSSSAASFPSNAARGSRKAEAAAAAVGRCTAGDGKIVVRRALAVEKPPRPGGNSSSSASRPPAMPRPWSRQKSLEEQATVEEEARSRRGSNPAALDSEAASIDGSVQSVTRSQDRFLGPPPRAMPRSLSSSGRPLSAGTGSCGRQRRRRSASLDRVPGEWPTPTRARERRPSLGGRNDEDQVVPTIRAF